MQRGLSDAWEVIQGDDGSGGSCSLRTAQGGPGQWAGVRRSQAIDSVWFHYRDPRVLNKKFGIPVLGFQSSSPFSQILLVKVPENNVALPKSAVPSKNNPGQETLKSCKNHNIERDSAEPKIPAMLRTAGAQISHTNQVICVKILSISLT